MATERPKAVKYWSVALGVFLAFGLVTRLLVAVGGNIALAVPLPPLWASLLMFAVQGVAVYGLWAMRKWGPVALLAIWLGFAFWPIQPEELGWMGSIWFNALFTIAFIAFFAVTLRHHWAKMTWAPLPIPDRAGEA